MQNRWGPWLPRVAGWLLAPALGLWLRLASSSTPGNTWTLDAAGHHRLIEFLVAHGRLPNPDPLTDLPAGRDIERFLPVGLYHAAAAWHHLLHAAAGQDLGWSLRVFVALAGALVAWPAWSAARSLGAGPWSASLAALVAATIPAHLKHTTAFLLRYEGLGTLLVATHLASGVAAIAAPSQRRVLFFAAISGLALVAALDVWRVALVIPVIEAASVALLAVRRQASPALRSWFGITAVALAIACVSIQYLRAQRTVLGAPTLMVLAAAIGLQSHGITMVASRALSRAVAVILPALGGAALGATLGSAGDYGAMWELLGHHALWWVGIEREARGLAGVLLTVRELQPMSPRALAGPAGLSWLGVWLLAAPLLLWLRPGRSPGAWANRASEALGMMLGIALGLGVLTLLANRHRLLLALPVAALSGAAVSALVQPVTREGGGGTARARLAVMIGIVTLLPCLLLMFRDGWRCATRAETRLTPGWSAALAFLRENATGHPVLSQWEHGYELQGVAGCATLTDGMLESPVNQSHVLGVARALLASTPDSLAALTDRFGVDFVVLAPSWSLFGVAMAAGDPLALRIASHQPLTREEADRVVIRMMMRGTEEGPFEPVFERDGYRVYRRRP